MKKSARIFHWLPRILCILAILFVSLFALDAFSPELSLLQQIGAFLMHLIPSFILLALLILAWKREFIGGIIFIIIGLGLSPFVFSHNYRMNHSVLMSLGIILTITIPFALVGILFIISHFKKKKNQEKEILNKFMSFFIITNTVFFLNCEKKTETVFITPNISVELPSNYEKIISNSKNSIITNPELTVENKIYGYTASIKNDDIFIGNLFTNEFDTLSLEQKKEKINPNLRGFMRGFNGNKLTQEDTIIHGLVQSNFSFEFKKKDGLFIVYGRLIIQENNLLFINYKSEIPITKKSIKEKDHFFKSIQFK